MKHLALEAQASSNGLRDRRRHRLHALQRRREVLRHRLRPCCARTAGRPRRSGASTFRSRTRGSGTLVGHDLVGEARSRRPTQVAVDHARRTAVPWQLGQPSPAPASPDDDHVQRRFQPEHARQPLRAAGAGQQAELDLRQRDLRVAAARRGSGSRAPARARRPCTRRGSRRPPAWSTSSSNGSGVSRFGSASALGVPNSLMSAPPENALPAPVMTIALHGVVGLRLVEAVDDAGARVVAQAVDRRVVQV